MAVVFSMAGYAYEIGSSQKVNLSVGETYQIGIKCTLTPYKYLIKVLPVTDIIATVSDDGLITPYKEGMEILEVQYYAGLGASMAYNTHIDSQFIMMTVTKPSIYRQPHDVTANCLEQTTLDPNIGVEGGKKPYKYQLQKFWPKYNNWLTTTEGVNGSTLTYKYPFETTRYRIIVTDANGDKVAHPTNPVGVCC